jgi:rhodanese-related sulfurtransferase
VKNVVKYAIVVLALVSLASVVASCGSTPAPVPTDVPVVVPTTAPVASPTSAEVAVPTSEPTSVPTEVPPTTAPAPEVVGTPTSPKEMPRISLEDLKALLDSGAKVAVLDVRPRESYDMAHIEGAISFPWKAQMTMGDAELLPYNTPIVTYCDCGPGEADSASVAFQLMQLGIGDIKVLADPSIDGWIAAGYPTG